MMIFAGGYWAPAVWGIVVLLSWIGWGVLVRRAAGIGEGRAGWGLCAAWGMATVLGICGFLQWAGACDQRGLTAVVILGVMAWALEAWGRVKRAEGQRRLMEGLRWRRWIAYSPLLVVLVYLYLTSVVAFDFNWWDDLPNYLVYGKKILQTGSLIEPYSLRRLLGYGGQQTMDAMLLLGGNFLNTDILEMGLGRIVFARLLLEMVQPKTVWEKVMAGLVVMVLVLVPRVPEMALNTQSAMTGVVLMVALVRTLGLGRGDGGGMRIAVVAGLVAAGLCTLRVSYLPGAVLAVGFFYLFQMATHRREWRAHAGNLLIAAGVVAVVLLPWAMVLRASNGTLLYPLWPGDQRPEYAYFDAALGFMGKVRWVVGFLGNAAGAVLMAPLMLSVARRFRRTELPIAAAALAAIVMTLLSYTLTEYVHIYRYVFPVTFAVGATLLVRGVMERRVRGLRLAAGAMVVVMAGMQLAPGVAWAVGTRGKVWTDEAESPLLQAVGSAGAYRTAQEAVPAGKAIFSATSFPVLFDYGRNPIFIADVPGAVSPAPGMPIFGGASAVREYLLAQGVEYVVFTLPEVDRTLYSKAYWEPIFSGERKALPDEVRCSKYNVAFIRCMEGLPATGKVVYRSRTLCVVALR